MCNHSFCLCSKCPQVFHHLCMFPNLSCMNWWLRQRHRPKMLSQSFCAVAPCKVADTSIWKRIVAPCIVASGKDTQNVQVGPAHSVRVHALEFSVCTELREAHVASHRGRRALGVGAGGWPHHRQPVPALSSMGYTSLGP